LVLRSISVPPSPSAFVAGTSRSLHESVDRNVAKAVPVERYLPPLAPLPVLVPTQAVSSLPVAVPLSESPVKSSQSLRKRREHARGERARAEGDLGPTICRGKGRYFINGGRSWRCRRG
jgi:hypothetical protein